MTGHDLLCSLHWCASPRISRSDPCLRYHPAMVPPRWPDEQGRPIPTYPCPRCGLEVTSRFRGFRVENLRHVGWWKLFRAKTYVNWCGHAQEIIPLPLPDGRVTFVPVLGEAS